MRVGAPGPAALQSQQQSERLQAKPSGLMEKIVGIFQSDASRARDLGVKIARLEKANHEYEYAVDTFKVRNVSVQELETRQSACYQKHAELSRRGVAAEGLDETFALAMDVLTASRELDDVSEALDHAKHLRNVARGEVASARQTLNKAHTKYVTLARKLGVSD